MKTLYPFSRRLVFLIISLILGCQYLSAQQPPDQEKWLFYTSENTGIPGSETYSVVVDNYDNTWVVTDEGLVRFDGAAWLSLGNYTHDKAISALAVDNYGKIWVATLDGALARYDSDTEEILIEPGSGMFDGYISTITFDSNNDIWFGTEYYLDGIEYSWFSCEESKLVKVEGLSVSDEPEWTIYDNTEFASYFVSEMAFDAIGNLWLSYSKGVIVKFDGSQFTEYNIFGYTGIGGDISFTIDQDNIIWIGDSEGMLVKFDGTNAEFIEPGYPDAGQPRFDFQSIISLAVDENNILWIGTDVGIIKYNGSSWFYYELQTRISSLDFDSDARVWAAGQNGLYVLEFGDDPVLYGSAGYKITYYGHNNTGLPDNYISAIENDSRGNCWIGLFDMGLSRFDRANWTTFQAANSDLPGDEIRTITGDDDDNIWIGTRNGLAKLSALSLEGQSWHIYNTGNCELPANSIRCLHYDNGILWIGTSLGLTRFDGDTWLTYNTDNSNLSHNDIRSIETDMDGNIWIGTYGGGLCKIAALSLNEPDWEIFNTANSALPDNMIFALKADSTGNIWIGTAYNGLVKYDGTVFTVYDTDNSDLPDDHIEALELDHENKLWIGMRYGGASEFDGTAWTNHGSILPAGAVYALDVDQYGNTWIGTAGGGVAVYNETGIASRNDLYLSGHLFLNGGDTPLDESMVELYPLGSTEYKEQIILSGTNAYAFTGQGYGQYTIRVLPDTVTYPETLPTWLGYKLTKAKASYIILSRSITDQDITVVQRPPSGGGTATVTGTLAVDEDRRKGTPVGDCYVYLLDAVDQTVKAFDITSSSGEFTFGKLARGAYIFYADYLGLPMDTSNPLLEISSSNDSLAVTALAGTEIISIVVEVITNIEKMFYNDMKIYPLPVSGFLTLSFTGDEAYHDIESISIVSLNGNLLYRNEAPQRDGSVITLDMSCYAPGAYLLRIEGKITSRYIKIIKI